MMVITTAARLFSALITCLIGISVTASELEGFEGVSSTLLKYHNGYFQLRENKQFNAAYALLTSKQKENLSRQELEMIWTSINDRFGSLTDLENTKITFFVNPEGQLPGRYAIVEFRARFEQPLVFCGSIVWAIDQGYRVNQEQISVLDPKTHVPLNSEELEDAYSKLGC